MSRAWQTAITERRFQAAAWVAAGFLHLALVVDPSVFYEHGGYFPVFQSGGEFLWSHLGRPGGVSRYASALLAQACASRWLGACALTVLAGGLAWGLGACVRNTSGRRTAGREALAFVIGLLIWTRYGFHVDSLVALLLAVLLATGCAHPRLDSATVSWRGALAIGLLASCYWACGGAMLVCALLMAAVEHDRRRRPALAALLLLAGMVWPLLLGSLLLGLPLQEAITALLPFRDTSRLEGGGLLGVLYGVAVWPGLTSLLRRHRDSRRTPPGSGVRLAFLARTWERLSNRGRLAVGWLAAVLVLAVAWSPQTARRMAVMKHSRAREWNRVLATAGRIRRERFTLDVSYAVNLALYHTGQLGERMFAFPQGPLSLTLGTAFGCSPNGEYYAERPKAFFDVGLANLDMGLVNEAEHLSHEALEIHGPHASVLKQLALVHLVKRRPAAARVCLEALRRDVAARAWAARMLEALQRSPAGLVEGEMVSGLRRNMPVRQDSHAPMLTLEERCLAQLEENAANRMAFEYLMAQLLITNNVEGFVRNLPRAEAFGLTVLPRHYQEALLVYEAQTGRAVPRWGFLVEPEVRDAFRRFAAELASHGSAGAAQTALPALAAFRDTYFHHHAWR